MKAVVAAPEGASLRDVPRPTPKADEVLVHVRAASLNRADLSALAARDGRILGMEWAGEILQVGSEVAHLQPRDRVMCTGSGAFAEYAVANAHRAIRIPDGALSFEEATVLALALPTMHDAIITNGRMARGESVLIHGASSAVGLIGLQIAKHMGAGRVIGTSQNAARRARLAEFGADVVLDAADASWGEHAFHACAGKGADVIIDQISGPGFNQVLKAAAIRGRIVNVGRLGGMAGGFDFDMHALKRASYVGVTFRTRTMEEIEGINRRMLAHLADAIAAKSIRLPVDSQFPLDEVSIALGRMKSNAHFGKIVLTM